MRLAASAIGDKDPVSLVAMKVLAHIGRCQSRLGSSDPMSLCEAFAKGSEAAAMATVVAGLPSETAELDVRIQSATDGGCWMFPRRS